MRDLNSAQCAVCGRKIDCTLKRLSDAWLDELEVCANLEMRR